MQVHGYYVGKVSKCFYYQGPALDAENNEKPDVLDCSSSVSPESMVNSEANVVLSSIKNTLNSGEEETLLA